MQLRRIVYIQLDKWRWGSRNWLLDGHLKIKKGPTANSSASSFGVVFIAAKNISTLDALWYPANANNYSFLVLRGGNPVRSSSHRRGAVCSLRSTFTFPQKWILLGKEEGTQSHTGSSSNISIQASRNAPTIGRGGIDMNDSPNSSYHIPTLYECKISYLHYWQSSSDKMYWWLIIKCLVSSTFTTRDIYLHLHNSSRY